MNSNLRFEFIEIETGIVERTIDSMSSHSQSTQPNGVVLYGGRYATMGNASDVLVIMDVLDGTSVYTDIKFSNIAQIQDASEKHFAVILNTGEIFVVKKSNGKIIKRSKDNFDISSCKNAMTGIFLDIA